MPTLTRILHVAHGIPSYHNSLLELADRLRKDGIELTVASHNDLSAVLQPKGHRFIQLSADTDLERQRQAALAQVNNLPTPVRTVRQLMISRQFRQQSLNTTELSRLIEHLKPELLLMDMECHKAIVLAHALPLPIVLLSRWYTVFKGDNIPPMHTLLQPAENRLDALRIQWRWVTLRLFKTRRMLGEYLSAQRFKSVTYATNSRVDLMALAKALAKAPENGQALSNVVALSTITDTSHWLIPHIYTQLPVMSLTLDELEFRHHPDPRMHYVGAMVGAQDTSHPKYHNGLHLFQTFHKARRHRENPLVYCSLSTFWKTQQDIMNTMIELFRQRPDMDLVMGLGGKQAAGLFADVPDNILLLDYAPQLEILKQADVAITHGGVSTINEAMVYGTPVIVCSSGHVDQNGCAARVAYHGVGVCCELEPLDSNELEKHIDHILKDKNQRVKNKVLAIQKRQQRYDADRAAIVFLQDAVKTKP